tara:strand:- start:363 stop:863 length:501 start_codon:yes stop_codon:yes gene_type:complete
MSQLKVDSIIPRGGLPSGSQGGIIQIQHTIFKTHSSFSADSYHDIGLSCTITPQSSSNHILCHFGVRCCPSGDARFTVKLVRGSTTLDIGNSGNSVPSDDIGLVDGTFESNRGAAPITALYLDTGIATTSSTTYKVQMQVSENFTINFRNGSTSGCSFMTLMEVSA